MALPYRGFNQRFNYRNGMTEDASRTPEGNVEPLEGFGD
jgi:hypothetical protein